MLFKFFSRKNIKKNRSLEALLDKAVKDDLLDEELLNTSEIDLLNHLKKAKREKRKILSDEVRRNKDAKFILDRLKSEYNIFSEEQINEIIKVIEDHKY